MNSCSAQDGKGSKGVNLICASGVDDTKSLACWKEYFARGANEKQAIGIRTSLILRSHGRTLRNWIRAIALISPRESELA